MGRVTPADVLALLLRSDAARPRITCYDDTDSPTRGERIELSGKVLANWVNKAANLLQDEWDLGPGNVLRLDLPAHWRCAYWALAAWSVGVSVRIGEGPADALVTTSPEVAAAAVEQGRYAALVTLPALARRAPQVPPGVLDEAAELATHPDDFTPWDEPDEADAALLLQHTDGDIATGVDIATSYGELVTARARRERVHLLDPDPATFLTSCLEVWAADGSVVLTRGSLDDQVRLEREHSEGIGPF